MNTLCDQWRLQKTNMGERLCAPLYTFHIFEVFRNIPEKDERIAIGFESSWPELRSPTNERHKIQQGWCLFWVLSC